MRVLVTRPAAQAQQWVQNLQALGIDAAALPLIEIAAAPDPQPVHAAWAALPGQRLVVFVSPNAAEHFFVLKPPNAAWPEGVQAGSPGPGTTQALRRLGVPAAAIVEPAADAAQFDSESLWQQLRRQDWPGAPVLVVRGDGGREWLADTLTAHGAEVGFVAAYHRQVPRWRSGEQALAAAAAAEPARHLWLFSSSESIDHLRALLPAAEWQHGRALASHPRIAARAHAAGFGAVHECRPTLAAVVGCIQSIAS